MATGFNPYSGFNQQQRMGGAYGGDMGAYGGGMGYGSRYGMGMKPPAAAVTGPVGSSSGSNPQAYEEGKQQMLEQQQRQQGVNAEVGAMRNDLARQGQEDQAKSIAAYRTARDNSQGAMDARNQRVAATQLGIDPSSSAADIASAASGKVGFGPNGMPTGGDTGQHLNPPGVAAPSSPGAVQPNATDIVNAARQVQAQKTGQQNAAVGSAYAAGANPRGQAGTGANPYTGGIAPHAVQPMGDPDAARKAVAMGVPPPPASSQPGVTLRPMAGVPAQPATQPPINPAMQPRPAFPAAGSAAMRPPVPTMSIPRSPALGTGPSAPPMSRRPKPTLAGATGPFQ